jgi:hypothetical protein
VYTRVSFLCNAYATGGPNVHAGGMTFLCFKRLTTAHQQGLSLFEDPADLFTCPLHVLGVVLVIHLTPGRRLFPQFPERAPVPLPSADDVGLFELLHQLKNGSGESEPLPAAQPRHKAEAVPGAQAYVNRLLTSVSIPPSVEEPGLTAMLPSHSFRRGGAMYPNADSNLISLWVIDRGGWSMSSISKVISNMLNSTQGYQKVARQLSGCAAT